MKVYEYLNSNWGKAFYRISSALHKYSPEWIQWSKRKEDSDVLLIHVVGGYELEHLETTKPAIIIQHCYFTAKPEVYDYPKYWERSLLTVSFHNLPEYTQRKFAFYLMPWGASPEQFYRDSRIKKEITILATGHVAETECIDKVFEACKNLNTKMVHTGHNFKWDSSYYRHMEYLNDSDFNTLLNKCNYISALRKIEGFELMAIEGLFCGARPIIPEAKTYDWYRKYAVTVDTSKDVTEQLVNIISKKPEPISDDEMKEIKNKFSWRPIMQNFYTTLEKTLF